LLFDVFEDELKELLKNGFVHRDLNRPSNISGDKYDNIFMTDNGLRLIDVGISALNTQVGAKLFEKYRLEELKELEIFKKYFFRKVISNPLHPLHYLQYSGANQRVLISQVHDLHHLLSIGVRVLATGFRSIFIHATVVF
jgi:serine/threonine protein kinase